MKMPWRRSLKIEKHVQEGRVLGIPGPHWFFLSISVPWQYRNGYRRHLENGTQIKIPRSVTKQLEPKELELLALIRIYVQRSKGETQWQDKRNASGAKSGSSGTGSSAPRTQTPKSSVS